jgi:hypothetical protein
MGASLESISLLSRLESFCRHHGIGILYSFGGRSGEIRREIDMGLVVGPGRSSDVDIAIKLPVRHYGGLDGKAFKSSKEELRLLWV